MVYRGSPAERKKMDLHSQPVVIMSYNIFRSDFERIQAWGRQRKLFIIGDELSLKSASQTFKKFKLLLYRTQRLREPLKAKSYHRFCALNATPISDRKQIYWWSAIFDPSIYPTLRWFESKHAGRKDHWGNVVEWQYESLMDDNFDSFSVLPKDVQHELPESVFTQVPYQLEPAHLRAYTALAKGLFEELPEEVTIDMVEALFSNLQKMVLCPQEFGVNATPPIFEIINQYRDQIAEEDKLIVYTRHVAVSRMLTQQYPDAVAVFGGVSTGKKRDNIRRFKAGEAEMMIANLDSLSKGQNLQVANHTIFAELPFRSDVMTQACGRTARQGQTKSTCFFLLPLAKGTIQIDIYKKLLANDIDLQKFNRNKKTLAEFIFGSSV